MKPVDTTKKHRIYTMSFSRVYPEYVNKAEKKGRTKAEVDELICWLTGYSQEGLEAQLENERAQMKLLTDSQHKGGWWAKFSSWFFKGK